MTEEARAKLRKVTAWVTPASQSGTARAEVLRLALPATGEQMLSMLVGIVDTFLVGHLGAESLAAVGLAFQWVFLANTLFGSIATGSTALIARFIGARDPALANRVMRQSVLIGAGIGLTTSVLAFSLAQPAVTLLGATGAVIELSAAYLRVASCSLLLATLMFIGNACLRGAGDTRTPLYIMGVVNALNILVAVVAINGLLGVPRMGVVGSALGVASAQSVGGIIVMAVLLRGRGQLRLRLGGLRPDFDLIRRILRVGLPTGVEQLLFRIGNMGYARVLASLGMEAYAANQVAINAWSLSFLPGFGFAVAATTLVGQSLGARRPDKAAQLGYTSFRLGAAVMSVIGVFFILFPGQIMAFFTNDAEVIRLGSLPLRLVGFVQPLSAAASIFAGGLRGAGDTRYPMLITGACIWLVRLPLAYLLAVGLGWGLTGGWTAVSLDLVFRGVFCFLRFRSGGWKTISV